MPTLHDKKKLMQLLDDAAQMQREQDEWRTGDAQRRRSELKLKTVIRKLEATQKQLDTSIQATEPLLKSLEMTITERQATVHELETKLDELETKRADKVTVLADLNKALTVRKATIDGELAAYSDQKKELIKAEILVVNSELAELQATAKGVQEQIEAKRTELGVLNQAAIDEQADLQVMKVEVAKEVTDKQAELVEVQVQLSEVQEKLQSMIYERDHAMATIQRAKDEHQKFMDYEEKARKLLDAKDRELQEKAAAISEQAQFMSNSRSFLPKL